MSGVSCLCSVALGGGGPFVARCFQFPLLVFCVLCCERLRLGHRWFPVCLCWRRPCAMRPASGSAPTQEVSRFHSLRPLAAACLSCAPGQSRPDELRALAASPATADRGARYPSRCAQPVGAPSRSGGFVQWFVLPLILSLVLVAAGAAGAGISGVASVTDDDTLKDWVLSAFGSTASMRPSRRRAAAPPARPGFDSGECRIVPPWLRNGRVVHSFRPSYLSPPSPAVVDRDLLCHPCDSVYRPCSRSRNS